jgi:hypothetical protein
MFLVEHLPSLAGIHLRMSLWLLGTMGSSVIETHSLIILDVSNSPYKRSTSHSRSDDTVSLRCSNQIRVQHNSNLDPVRWTGWLILADADLL